MSTIVSRCRKGKWGGCEPSIYMMTLPLYHLRQSQKPVQLKCTVTSTASTKGHRQDKTPLLPHLMGFLSRPVLFSTRQLSGGGAILPAGSTNLAPSSSSPHGQGCRHSDSRTNRISGQFKDTQSGIRSIGRGASRVPLLDT